MATFRGLFGYNYREELTVFLTVSDSKHENDAVSLLERMHPCGYSVLAVRKMQTQTNLLTQGQQ